MSGPNCVQSNTYQDLNKSVLVLVTLFAAHGNICNTGGYEDVVAKFRCLWGLCLQFKHPDSPKRALPPANADFRGA